METTTTITAPASAPNIPCEEYWKAVVAVLEREEPNYTDWLGLMEEDLWLDVMADSQWDMNPTECAEYILEGIAEAEFIAHEHERYWG